jgi:uncharacterized protein (DUF1015 family)
MAEVIPFQGWRYNTQKISDIHSVFSPLSDVLNPTLMRSMYANPLSSLHLSVPISHISAFSKIQQWKADEFLIQDPAPRFYVLYQTFRLPNEATIYTRKGILCGIKLKDKADDDIVIHENTIVEAVKDRTLYLQKIHMNIVPTHGLFEDKDHEIEALLDSSSKEFLYEYTDIQNVRNTLYTWDEAAMIEKIQAILADKKIYLADGHTA